VDGLPADTNRGHAGWRQDDAFFGRGLAKMLEQGGFACTRAAGEQEMG
jgi:hypothetical protein